MKSNRAAALRWLADHVGVVLDTVQTDAAGTITWIPGPRTLTKESRKDGFSMANAAGRRSWLSTDRGNRFYVNGDTLTIEALTGITSGPSGVRETWHITHYSVRTDEAFVTVNTIDGAATYGVKA